VCVCVCVVYSPPLGGVYVCVHTQSILSVCVYTQPALVHACVYTQSAVSVCMFNYNQSFTYVYVYIVRLCVHVCMCVHNQPLVHCVYVCVCVSVCVCVHSQTLGYVFVYVYINNQPLASTCICRFNQQL
jgi:hypothetical protein